jgi:hypothetical protein
MIASRAKVVAGIADINAEALGRVRVEHQITEGILIRRVTVRSAIEAFVRALHRQAVNEPWAGLYHQTK